MGQIQLINITEQELKEGLMKEFRKELEALKENYKPKEPTEYLTRKKTSELLDINLSTLWNWTKKGIIQAYGAGNRVYYKRSDIEAMLKPINEVDHE